MLDDFKFGAASSAYQIEGAWNENGKTPSIWDEISHGETRYKVKNKHTGNVACDHYHHWNDDIKLMEILGLQAYRFSISWSRICSEKNCSNIKGVDFYRNLVKELKKAGIEPFVTLYHWDLPKWLDDIGGWSNPKIVEHFKRYAETMFEALPDVKYWISINEPAVFVSNYWGHENKIKAIENILKAHVEVAKIKEDRKLGISLNLMPVYPYSPGNPKNDYAVDNLDKLHNRIWLDPLFKGHLPDGINKLLNGDEKLKFKTSLAPSVDFLGINYYTAVTVSYNKYRPNKFQIMPSNFKRDEMGVEIIPVGLLKLLKDIKKDYNNPEIYITENGCACPDTFVHDSKIHDTERIDYIRDHLYYCNEAIKKGVNLKGYFYWSLMDNFEWLYGYNKRFGLLYIFYPNQGRVCKDSYHWYQKIITDKKFRKKEICLRKKE
jgi:beta-glucosidase